MSKKLLEEQNHLMSYQVGRVGEMVSGSGIPELSRMQNPDDCSTAPDGEGEGGEEKRWGVDCLYRQMFEN